MVDSGVILLKYWLEVSPEEQTRRLEGRIKDRRKIWKTLADGPEVLQPLVRLLPWRGTTCFSRPTDSEFAPWHVAKSDDKKRARLNIITPPARQGSIQAGASRKGQAAQEAKAGRPSAKRNIRSSSSTRNIEAGATGRDSPVAPPYFGSDGRRARIPRPPMRVPPGARPAPSTSSPASRRRIRTRPQRPCAGRPPCRSASSDASGQRR